MAKTKKDPAKLNDVQRAAIVAWFACHVPLAQVMRYLREYWPDIDVTPQAVHKYNLDAPSSVGMAKKWAELFDETRQRFYDQTASLPITQRAYRLHKLQGAVERAEARGNDVLMAQMLEQASKEVGGMFIRESGHRGAGSLDNRPQVSAGTDPRDDTHFIKLLEQFDGR